jgi:hypothetical protein
VKRTGHQGPAYRSQATVGVLLMLARIDLERGTLPAQNFFAAVAANGTKPEPLHCRDGAAEIAYKTTPEFAEIPKMTLLWVLYILKCLRNKVSCTPKKLILEARIQSP